MAKNCGWFLDLANIDGNKYRYKERKEHINATIGQTIISIRT